MRILVTGSNGFLGQKLVKRLAAKPTYSIFCTSGSPNRMDQHTPHDFAQVDFNDPSALLEIIKSFRPTHIIHTAAISSVDVCEKDPARCQTVNVDIVHELATVAKAQDIHLTFLSTDFVFDGQQGPYVETDATAACNAYGQSKIAAEQLIQQSGCRHAILRTILVYGTPNKGSSVRNLVIWAKEALSNQETIRVVADQWRMPTWVEDLVEACHLAAKKGAEGIFHISGEEMMSIQEVVQEVANYWKLDHSLIQPITAKEIGQDKNRPRKTGFVLDKAQRELGYTPTPFHLSLERIDEELHII